MKYKMILIWALFSLLIHAQSQRILLDEEYSDWENIDPVYTDTENDQLSGNIDFGRLWISNDENFLFIRVELGGKINLQNDNSITLYIDTDNSSETGLSVSNIGAELEYTFGERRGNIRLGNSVYQISHSEISLITSPTVTSTEFEIAIGLNAEIDELRLFPNDNLNILLIDQSSGKDQMPNLGEVVSFMIMEQDSDPLPQYSLLKQGENVLRVLSYNVLRDNLFAPNLFDTYSSILKTVNPDIIGFQEIYDHSSQETAELIEQILPSNGGEWYHSKAEDINPINPYNTDLIVVSRFRIKKSFRIEGFYIEGSVEDRANFAVLIDLRPKYNSDLLVINAHPPCCSRDDRRQEEVDKIMAFIRDAKNAGGELSLDQNTPILILGDMNFVGLDLQRNTLLTGDISDNGAYGPDFQPDWNATDLADTRPYTTDLPMTFTWYNEDEGYSPGRLDYIIYTSSALKYVNGYSLFTPALDSDLLESLGLGMLDAVQASDHLPLIADFELKNVTSTDENMGYNIENNFELLQNYPNPFNPLTWIEYTLPSNQESNKLNNTSSGFQVNLGIYDSVGRKVKTLVNKYLMPGKYQTVFNASNLSSGIYYYSLDYNDNRLVKKMILLK